MSNNCFEKELIIQEDYRKSKYWINKAYEGIDPKISKKAKVFWNKHKLWNY